MSTSRLPTELTNLGQTTTTPPDTRIGLVPLFVENTKSYWLWLRPGPQLGEDSEKLCQMVLKNALEHAKGAAPSTRDEWEEHLRSACQNTEYKSLRASLNPGKEVVRLGARHVGSKEASLRKKSCVDILDHGEQGYSQRHSVL